ncbi:MAG TPA: glycoside hydrolase family 2 TIM barrel-domain containing protein [Bryobacteraceae bacterium]|nr:glycoside hydrolase family 2 TIM barrel-domain containing protein [Bryobacteraceae bacterium]
MAVLSTSVNTPDVDLAATGIPLPRPEYPRPDFVREDWLNLNGYWNFAFDDRNIGLEQRWFSGIPDAKQILVPFSFEALRSGIGERSFHPCVWYQRSFEVPAAWDQRRVLLNFGAVDYRALVWVNGIVVGSHEGGHTPFCLDVTGALTAGKNTVVVRVEDPPTDRYIPRGKQHWEETPASIFYARTTGIWQTVWLEPVSPSYLRNVRITSTTAGSITVSAKIASPSTSQFMTMTVIDRGRTLASAMSLADGPTVTVSAHISDPVLWSPDTPHLYDLRLELHGPEGRLDAVASYFGIRSIGTQDGKVILNGNPLYLKTVLDQGYWPESNLTPPSDEAIIEDIRRTKDLGFNGVRKHQKVEDPRYLYWADRMGLLVAAEMANAYLFNSESVARMTREWIEVVTRDYNHPCIIIWTPLNESWGVPNLAEPRQQAHVKALYYLTKSLDGTRLVIDNDGWEHTEVTDLFAIHDYTRTGEEFLARFHNITQGLPLPLYGKLYVAPGHRYNGSPILLWEFGGVGYVLPEDLSKVPGNSWGYSGMEAENDAALSRIRGLYAAVASIRQIAGVCYTQLYDVEQEVNGLMTYDRRMKFDPRAIREINSLLV